MDTILQGMIEEELPDLNTLAIEHGLDSKMDTTELILQLLELLDPEDERCTVSDVPLLCQGQSHWFDIEIKESGRRLSFIGLGIDTPKQKTEKELNKWLLALLNPSKTCAPFFDIFLEVKGTGLDNLLDGCFSGSVRCQKQFQDRARFYRTDLDSIYSTLPLTAMQQGLWELNEGHVTCKEIRRFLGDDLTMGSEKKRIPKQLETVSEPILRTKLRRDINMREKTLGTSTVNLKKEYTKMSPIIETLEIICNENPEAQLPIRQLRQITEGLLKRVAQSLNHTQELIAQYGLVRFLEKVPDVKPGQPNRIQNVIVIADKDQINQYVEIWRRLAAHGVVKIISSLSPKCLDLSRTVRFQKNTSN